LRFKISNYIILLFMAIH